jgi:hypothetical protein
MGIAQKMMNLFQGDVLAKVRAIPETAEYAKQPDFVEKILEIQKNPKALRKYDLLLLLSLTLTHTQAQILSLSF